MMPQQQKAYLETLLYFLNVPNNIAPDLFDLNASIIVRQITQTNGVIGIEVLKRFSTAFKQICELTEVHTRTFMWTWIIIFLLVFEPRFYVEFGQFVGCDSAYVFTVAFFLLKVGARTRNPFPF